MEIPFYEHEWHGIPLEGIKAQEGLGQLAQASFYDAFYNRLSADYELNSQWLTPKLNLAKWIETACLQPLAGDSLSSLTVLSLGAGLGVMEEEWVNKGYKVSVQECQKSSLKVFSERHPQVKVFIGDARYVDAPNGEFDVVVMSAVDYVFDRQGYIQLLDEVSRLLKKGGLAIMVTVSNLTLMQMSRAVVKGILVKLKRDLRGKQVMFWGWKRTVASHLSVGANCGLKCERTYLFDDVFHVIATRGPLAAKLIPSGSARVGVLWRKG